MDLQRVLTSLPRPSTPGFKFRVALGFFDPQTRFFQPTIPNDVFEFFVHGLSSKPIKGVVVDTIPVVQAFQGFEKHAHVVGTMWDVRIDYVQCERQGIFLNSGTKTIIAVCSLEFLERMNTAFEEFISIQPEAGTSFVDCTVGLAAPTTSGFPGPKMNCELVVH